MNWMKRYWNDYRLDMLTLALGAGAFMWVMYAFTGQWPWGGNSYNTYTLQACAWLKGQLDLGRDYPHLELAIYQGRYFVSFPPFPSFVMLPFAIFLGEKTPDGWIALATGIAGIIYTYKTFCLFRGTREHAMFWAFFLAFGTNLVFVKLNGWVWFIAQNMCFTLSMMAIYYAKKGKAGLSLAFWACSVGCRPLQVLYFPVLCFFLWQEAKKEMPDGNLISIIKSKALCAVPMIIIAIVYMLLNYARFGSITEFGHNYLPEFMRTSEGQFHISYIGQNMKNLFRLPAAAEYGRLDFYNMNGFAFWMTSPVFISYLIYLVRSIVRRKKESGYEAERTWFQAVLMVLMILHILLLLSHRTMGGWHFGNRYINDLLPYLFTGILLLMPEKDRTLRLHYVLCIFGAAVNLLGSAAVYNYWI